MFTKVLVDIHKMFCLHFGKMKVCQPFYVNSVEFRFMRSLSGSSAATAFTVLPNANI